jgi:hypothetical protein
MSIVMVIYGYTLTHLIQTLKKYNLTNFTHNINIYSINLKDLESNIIIVIKV